MRKVLYLGLCVLLVVGLVVLTGCGDDNSANANTPATITTAPVASAVQSAAAAVESAVKPDKPAESAAADASVAPAQSAEASMVPDASASADTAA